MHRIATAFAIGSILISLAAGCRHPTKPESRIPSGEVFLSAEQVTNSRIEVTTIQNTEIGRELAAPGRIAFDDLQVGHVYSPVNGRVIRLLANPGQHVRPGDVLAVLQSPDLGAAFADYAKAKAALNVARRDYERQKQLFAGHAVAQRDAEAAEGVFRQAEAEMNRAEKRARLLRRESTDQVTQEYLLRSPIAGEVISRNLNPGTEVQGQYSGGTATELFTVGDLSRVWVLADVYEVDLPRVQLNAPVTVRVASQPDRVFLGKVDWISGAFDPASRTTKIRSSLDNRDRTLRPEMYATVSIRAASGSGIVVPRSAVLRLGDQTVVFRRAGSSRRGLIRFQVRPVRVDDEGGAGPIAVLSGVAVGDQIVTAGGELLAGQVSR
jgi:cobalt-zinc-cadmium efflux system membrane fusion protein